MFLLIHEKNDRFVYAGGGGTLLKLTEKCEKTKLKKQRWYGLCQINIDILTSIFVHY